MDLERLLRVPGLEQLENRACTAVSQDVHPNLTHLSQVMEPAIEQVSERVYSAVGFDVANATFVVGQPCDPGICRGSGRRPGGAPRPQHAGYLPG